MRINTNVMLLWLGRVLFVVIASPEQLFIMSMTEVVHKKQWVADGFQNGMGYPFRNSSVISPARAN